MGVNRQLPDDALLQVTGLKHAAALIVKKGASAADVPIDDCLVDILESAAELIQFHGTSIGLPVNYPLEIAGRIIGSDLRHNK